MVDQSHLPVVAVDIPLFLLRHIRPSHHIPLDPHIHLYHPRDRPCGSRLGLYRLFLLDLLLELQRVLDGRFEVGNWDHYSVLLLFYPGHLGLLISSARLKAARSSPSYLELPGSRFGLLLLALSVGLALSRSRSAPRSRRGER